MKKFYLSILLALISTQIYCQPFDLQGHRGARGLMPENSIPGFIKALEFGVTTLEMDVVISADKKVVVSHEPWFNSRICTGPGQKRIDKGEAKELNIYQMNYDQIRAFDCGIIGNPGFPDQEKISVHKPLLSDVIREVEKTIEQDNGYSVHYNIEIKSNENTDNEYHPVPSEFVELVYQTIDELLTWDRVVIQSFDMRVLQYLHQEYDHVPLALLIQNLKSVEANLDDLGFHPSIYSPNFKLIKKDDLEFLHTRGIKLIPWTVNEKEDMTRLKDLGVDGLITDYPDRAASLGMGLKN